MIFCVAGILFVGQRYYSKVRVHDSGGLASSYVISNGVLVDQTPPTTTGSLKAGENRLQDGSFEKDNTEWISFGNVKKYNNVSKSGNYSLLVYGSVKWEIINLGTDLVKITFWTRPVMSSSQDNHQDIIGYMHCGTVHRTFSIRTMDKVWQMHNYFCPVAKDTHLALTIGGIIDDHKFLIDDVSVEAITYDKEDIEQNPVMVKVVPGPTNQGYVSASWGITDPESPVVNFKWAVGTVKGRFNLCLITLDVL